MTTNDLQTLLKKIPGVDYLLEKVKHNSDFKAIPLSVIKLSTRETLQTIRKKIINNAQSSNGMNINLHQNAISHEHQDAISHEHQDAISHENQDAISHENQDAIFHENIIRNILIHAREIIEPRLVPTINATGVVLHTNLGRSLLCQDALDRITQIANGFSNLEFDINSGKRGERYSAVEQLLCELTGAESAMVVNNNAGAVFLCLNTLAREQEVIVSRGELVEIGGSFRIPDVMEKSGCKLKEVGTTNRTHPRDYKSAINEKTALLLKVHTSNYTIEGFTSSVSLSELVAIGKEYNLLIMEDLGSGSLIDLSKYGLSREPTVSDVVLSGADIVTFSGDKLLGGPQAGLIIGRYDAIKKIKANPLTRALRIDKLTLAALEATLNLYRDEAQALKKIPTLRMLTTTFQDTSDRAEKLINDIKLTIGQVADSVIVGYADLSSRTGGGSYPEYPIPSRCVTIEPKKMSVTMLEKKMRMNKPAIIGRIDNNRFIIDPRTLQDGEYKIICNALADILTH